MVLRACWNAGSGLLFRLLSKSKRAGMAGVDYPAVWKGRPGFLDCDVNLHLNNASYFLSMELARWHFTACAVKHRHLYFAGSQAIRYRHAIPLFHAYEVHTQMVYWDDQWTYLLHHFQCPTTGKLYAEGFCRVMVKAGGQRVLFAELVGEVNDGEVPPRPSEMPAVVRGFLEYDAASRTSMENAADRAKLNIEASPPPPTPERLSERIWAEMQRSMNRPW
ncbi:hypothetical protein BBJ28_00016830 [Nothophytophthora sp. Chile5]|nr:hypothetical protein BBJ28_00016830 [Nothophytophthora sp. Chile5]